MGGRLNDNDSPALTIAAGVLLALLVVLGLGVLSAVVALLT